MKECIISGASRVMVKSTSQVPKKCSTIAVRLKYLLRLRREPGLTLTGSGMQLDEKILKHISLTITRISSA